VPTADSTVGPKCNVAPSVRVCIAMKPDATRGQVASVFGLVDEMPSRETVWRALRACFHIHSVVLHKALSGLLFSQSSIWS